MTPATEAAADAAPAIDGPAYPLAVKLLAHGLMAAVLGLGWQHRGELTGSGAGGIAVAAAVLVVIAAGYWDVVRGRVSIDGQAIRHRSLWTREVRLVDITQIKLICIPGLSWIVVPRLVVRKRGWSVTTFCAGDARLLAAFRRLAYGTP